MIDELGISAVIDEALPKTRNHILPHSAVVKAMLLNGLGFNERRLYFFSRFFTNLSTEQLFGVTGGVKMYRCGGLILYTPPHKLIGN